MPPFQVPSTTFLQPLWSLFQHISLSAVLQYIYIHNIIYIHRPFSQGPFTSHIHISKFATILGQYSYFYRLGEIGCYIEHLIIDFEILNKFKALNLGLLVMSYASCIDLEILIKEMEDYDIPFDLQWKEIIRLGKKKCIFLGPEKWCPDVTRDGRSCERLNKKKWWRKGLKRQRNHNPDQETFSC